MKSVETRSQLYALFSKLMRFPEQQLWAPSIVERRINELDELLNALPYENSLIGIALEGGLNLDQLNIEFTNSFESSTAAIPLHGRSYIGDGEKKLFEELFRFYQHFGLELNKSNNDFWPDSLQMELEFMHYMTYIESLNDKTRISIMKGQRDFLQRQLGPLLSGLAKKASEAVPSTYTPLVSLIADFAMAELNYLNDTLGDQISFQHVS